MKLGGGDIFTATKNLCSKTDSPVFFWVQRHFQIENRLKFPKRSEFSKIFKIILDSSQKGLFDQKFFPEKLQIGPYVRKYDVLQYYVILLMMSQNLDNTTYDLISPHIFDSSKQIPLLSFSV